MPSWLLLPLRRTVDFTERKGLDIGDLYQCCCFLFCVDCDGVGMEVGRDGGKEGREWTEGRKGGKEGREGRGGLGVLND